MTNEVLRDTVETMIKVNEAMKTHKTHLKSLNKTYKELNERVKAHMKGAELKYIDLPSHQVHTYSRVRPPAMNAEFLESGLRAFFSETKTKVGKSTSTDAALFLAERKKAKVGGTEVWTTTIRQSRKAKGEAGRGTKRKCGFAGRLDDDDPLNMDADPLSIGAGAPDPARVEM